MKLMIFAFLMLLGVVLAAQQCKTKKDCSADHYCVFGYCSSRSTFDKFNTLQTAKRNRAHKRLQAKKSWPECSDDADCKAGEKCHGGACQASIKKRSTWPECSDDIDCRAGETCRGGACQGPL